MPRIPRLLPHFQHTEGNLVPSFFNSRPIKSQNTTTINFLLCSVSHTNCVIKRFTVFNILMWHMIWLEEKIAIKKKRILWRGGGDLHYQAPETWRPLKSQRVTVWWSCNGPELKGETAPWRDGPIKWIVLSAVTSRGQKVTLGGWLVGPYSLQGRMFLGDPSFLSRLCF